MDSTLLLSLLLVTPGLGVTLLARKPVRHLFGAGPAFTLWGLPLLLAMAPWLPAPTFAWMWLPPIRVLPAAQAVAAAASAHATHAWLRDLWLIGVAAGLLRLALHHARLRRASRPLPPAMRHILLAEHSGLDARRLRLHPAGPALLWAPRCLLLLPADFLERYDATERRLMLRHELTHLRRGDAWWSLLAELAIALLWFHPLAWLALPRFRLDQELACDERVLRTAPEDDARYARTLLHSTGMDTRPVLIPWLAEPQLKERLTMIRRNPRSTSRRRLGYGVSIALLAGGLCAAQATTPGSVNAGANQDTTRNAHIAPRYPADSLHNKEQGAVILTVQVHADGTPGTIVYDAAHSTTASADLIAASSEAVRHWHFNPEMKNGKPVDGYVRVPIDFSLTKLDSTSRGKAQELSSKSLKSS